MTTKVYCENDLEKTTLAQNLHGLLQQKLPRTINTAIATESKKISYCELHELIDHFMDQYANLGIRPGDQVGLFIRDQLNFVIHYLALWSLGATVALFDHQIKHDRFEKQLDAIELSWLFCDGELSLESTYEEVKNFDEVKVYFFGKRTHKLLEMFPDSNGFIILFTSGTQNEPKPVVLLKNSILNNVQKVIEYTRLTQTDKTLLTLPLSYSYAMSQCLSHFFVGGEIHLVSCGFMIDLVLAEWRKRRITNFAATPYFYETIASKLENEKLDLSLYFTEGRFFMNAGGYLAPECIKKILTHATGIAFFNNYGQTEASPRLSFCEFNSSSSDFSSVGWPLRGVSFKIMDFDEAGIGKIYYRSEDFMQGYYPMIEKEPSSAYVDTGDIGFINKNGSLTIVGRSDSMIKLNGRKCYINHIEEKILTLPSIKHVKVIKTFHDIYGEFLTAYVVPIEAQQNSGSFIKELKQQLSNVLMTHEMPRAFHVIDEFQLSSNGKVQKSALRNTL